MKTETQLDKVIDALASLGGQASLIEIYSKLPDEPQDSVRRVLQAHCEESKTFLGKGNGLFHSVYGIESRKGIWAFVGNVPPQFDNTDSPAQREWKLQQFILRNKSIILRAKLARDFNCQICKNAPTKPDGERIVQGHHIQPLGNEHQGPDELANILIVCPNCHALCDAFAIKLSPSLSGDEQNGHIISSRFINYHNHRYEKIWGAK